MNQEPLYQQLVNEWITLIQNGVMQAGERLPSVRKACDIHKVSPSTILLAYRTLEDRGFIEARPQSGFMSKPPPACRCHACAARARPRPPAKWWTISKR
jgi:DNA-binding transcriptional regulator YhcF (GntR family)